MKGELVNAKKSKKAASASLRTTLQKAAQIRLMEKEKEKSKGSSCAMRISLQVSKVVWSMLLDGKSFAEAEINDLVSIPKHLFSFIFFYFTLNSKGNFCKNHSSHNGDLLVCILSQIFDFDRDYKDVGVALFTTKFVVVRNCLPNAKSDTILSAWNPPPEWGKYDLFFSIYLLFRSYLGPYFLVMHSNILIKTYLNNFFTKIFYVTQNN